MMLEELLHTTELETESSTVGTRIVLALIRDECPWIYEAGMEALKIITSRVARKEKDQALHFFMRIVEFSFDHPLMRERWERSREWHVMSRKLPHMLKHGMLMALEG